MPQRLHKSLLDYLVIAISPAMIMVLIDSLVLFLIQVFYRGGFQGRLAYVLTLFVIGAVLIGRISIEEGRERAMLFAAPLGIAILLAINRFVGFHGSLAAFNFLLNCGLIALIWWSADKLTWDCTLIDEQEEDSGEGLLETVGLDRPDHAAMQREIEPVPRGRLTGAKGDSPIFADTKVGTVPVPETEATTSREDVPTSWWGRFVERRRRPHAPGVWVVYFSLAALPLFGLGELFIPNNDMAARQYAFQLLFYYTASGLGLLLSTSFLGLRRYLRQRRQEMPLTMVNLWLGIGAALIVGVMFAAMLLPRPNAEYSISELPIDVGSPEQNASRTGVGPEGVEEERPDARLEPREDAKPDAPQSNEPGKSEFATSHNDDAKPADNGKEPSKGAQKQGKRAEDDAGQKSANNGKEPSKDKRKSEKTGDDKGGQKQGDSKHQDQEPGKNGDNRPANGQTKSSEKPPANQEPDENAKSREGSGAAKVKPPEKQPKRPEDGRRSGGSPRAPAAPRVSVPHGFSAIGVLFKWILYIALAVIVAYALWKNRAELLAALRDFRQTLADFWRKLFGGKMREAEEAAAKEGSQEKPLRRFADFTDPFATGAAGRYRPEELVRYTFEALEAWAREGGHSRLPDQTPHEFARSLAASVASLADDTRLLADLYCQVAYAPGTLQVAMVTRLPHLWQEMRAASGNRSWGVTKLEGSYGEVACLSAITGEVLWTATVGSSIVSQPVVAGGRIYVSTNADVLYCLETGDPKDDGWLMWGANAVHTGSVGEGELQQAGGKGVPLAFHAAFRE